MHRLFALLTALALASPAAAGEPPPVIVNGQVVTPSQPDATVQPFGKGALVKQRGKPATTVVPFGHSVLIKEPGKPPVTCTPFGSTTVCK
jgi:hypothetical protein